MTKAQANAEAAHLLGLFPNLSSEQVLDWASEFEKHEQADVRRAVVKHHRDGGRDGFVYGPALLALVKAAERDGVLKREAERRRQEDEKAREYTRRVDAVIAEMTDEELEIRKDIALGEMKPAAREMLRDRNPRTSMALKTAIYDRVQGEVSAA